MVNIPAHFAKDKFYSLTDLIAIRRFLRNEGYKVSPWFHTKHLKDVLEALAVRIEQKRRNGETEPTRNQYTPVSEKRRCRANAN